MQLKASAPGSLMLLGEYGVLSGKHALVSAINKRIYVSLKPRTDQQIEIHSALFGPHTTVLGQIVVKPPYHFVLAVLKQYETRLKQGFDMSIEADFSDQVGLGSSAAVTVATLAAIIGVLNVKLTPLDLIRQGRNIIRTVQGIGSGADIAASVCGGMVGYQSQPLSAEKFPVSFPLVVLYSGFKTKTVDAIKKVQHYFSEHPHLLAQLQISIGQCATAGLQAVRKGDFKTLGQMLNIQQGLMDAIGVNLPVLNDMVFALRKESTILGTKISGSGLGDCIVGLGELSQTFSLPDYPNVQQIPVEMTTQGVICEKS